MRAKKLVIVGDNAFAQIAYHYFSESDDYQVVGFSVEQQFLRNTELFKLPIVAFNQLAEIFPATEHTVFVAITYNHLNRTRTRLVHTARKLGYPLASYVSPHAFVSNQAKLGEHCFIFERNVIQSYCEIGENVILWSGNHIGHHSKIGANSFISSHVVISGFVSVGDYCFFGVNSTVANNLTIGDDCWFGPAAVVTKNVQTGTLIPPVESLPSRVSTYKFFKVNHTKDTTYARS